MDTMFEKSRISKFTLVCTERVPIFCMGAYKHVVIVVPIFMGCFFCVSAYYPDFTVCKSSSSEKIDPHQALERYLARMFMIEFKKSRSFLEMNDEMEWEPITL